MDLTIETLLQNLIKSNAALENFASIVAYDLQEPLNKIINLNQKLKAKCSNKLDNQGIEYLEHIDTTSKRMKNLLESLLRYSLLNNQEIKFTKTNLGKVFDTVINDVKAKLENNNAQVQIIGNPPQIDADQELITELLKSLINNAIHFRKPNSSLLIKIEITTSNDLVKIEVEDNGIGFGTDDSNAIFKQFEKLNKVNEYNGIGIALSFCKIIAEKHQGSLFAKSEEGKGSTFTLLLPLLQQ